MSYAAQRQSQLAYWVPLTVHAHLLIGRNVQWPLHMTFPISQNQLLHTLHTQTMT